MTRKDWGMLLLLFLGFFPVMLILTATPRLEVSIFNLGTASGNALFNSAAMPALLLLWTRNRPKSGNWSIVTGGMVLGYTCGIIARLMIGAVAGRPIVLAFVNWSFRLPQTAAIIWAAANILICIAVAIACGFAFGRPEGRAR